MKLNGNGAIDGRLNPYSVPARSAYGQQAVLVPVQYAGYQQQLSYPIQQQQAPYTPSTSSYPSYPHPPSPSSPIAQPYSEQTTSQPSSGPLILAPPPLWYTPTNPELGYATLQPTTALMHANASGNASASAHAAASNTNGIGRAGYVGYRSWDGSQGGQAGLGHGVPRAGLWAKPGFASANGNGENTGHATMPQVGLVAYSSFGA